MSELAVSRAPWNRQLPRPEEAMEIRGHVVVTPSDILPVFVEAEVFADKHFWPAVHLVLPNQPIPPATTPVQTMRSVLQRAKAHLHDQTLSEVYHTTEAASRPLFIDKGWLWPAADLLEHPEFAGMRGRTEEDHIRTPLGLGVIAVTSRTHAPEFTVGYADLYTGAYVSQMLPITDIIGSNIHRPRLVEPGRKTGPGGQSSTSGGVRPAKIIQTAEGDAEYL